MNIFRKLNYSQSAHKVHDFITETWIISKFKDNWEREKTHYFKVRTKAHQQTPSIQCQNPSLQLQTNSLVCNSHDYSTFFILLIPTTIKHILSLIFTQSNCEISREERDERLRSAQGKATGRYKRKREDHHLKQNCDYDERRASRKEKKDRKRGWMKKRFRQNERII